ncbi:hypothetical protein [Pandoraea apista]|uniref:Uncharacterized protein n=1 Tax=Pandoraea apista TaxID=93218 RepID=A0A5E5P230_9BURK|nr:hypothetical protein [Pandoraea apista]OXS89594.1 hypothetical protein B7H01_20120 [Pandoraea apista]VVG70648.1 hypothetical protein PAP18089_01612 [Pandoraea apista]
MSQIYRDLELGPYCARILAMPVPSNEVGTPAGFIAHGVIKRADGAAVVENFRAYESGEIRPEPNGVFRDAHLALNAGEQWASELMNNWYDRGNG